jgi:hypothetical protein
VTQLGTYGFLPWIRNGVANTITSPDLDPSVKTRASVNVALRVSGEPVAGGNALTQDIQQPVALYGPGDVVGIESRAIVRTEPRNWNTNFESNYLAAIEFYDHDFLWRYTPAAADTADPGRGSNLRLRPWIALVVLTEDEFKESQDLGKRPAQCITVADPSVFPPATELGSWAHVHFNESLGATPTELVSPDMTAVLPRVLAAVTSNPDIAYSRLLCPRRLAENTVYHAFVMPVFESGRLAGLGEDPGQAPHATFSAWDAYSGRTDPTYFPFYYRWYFRTGSLGDFEYLVGLLKPQPMDPKFGTRDMDVLYPGSGIPGITDAALGGVLRLGGALRVPDADLTTTQRQERQRYERWDQNPYPHPFEKGLAAFVNLADDYSTATPGAANAASGLGSGVATNPDPLITAPLYGRWHALTQRLLTNADGTDAPNRSNWVHRLNLDPGYRVLAGFGANVVEQNAETYMNAAWEQIGDVLAANQRIRRLHFAVAISARWYDNHLQPLARVNPERAYQVAAPAAARVVSGNQTLAYAQRSSPLGSTLTSAAFRRVLRPNARFVRSLPFTTTNTPATLLQRVNAGSVSAAPPVVVPPGVATVDQAGNTIETNSGAPPWVAGILARLPSLPGLILICALILAVLLWLLIPGIGWALGIAIAAGGFALYRRVRRWAAIGAVASAVTPAQQTPAKVNRLPYSPNFTLSIAGSADSPTIGLTDSPTAANFKTGLRDSFALLQAGLAVDATPKLTPLQLNTVTTAAVFAVNPRATILKRGFSSLQIPGWIQVTLEDPANEVMAYPKINLPMYRPLKDISIELLVPNLSVIPPNSITIVETNQKFVEAYMVGLNHEFARKLLWREYPTDQRGSYFRQFWDPSPYLDTTPPDPAKTEQQNEELAQERHYDIKPLHEWPLDSALGTHSSHGPTSTTGEDAVLVIRGELLKKYPRAVIYAHRAAWRLNSQGNPDVTLPRELVQVSDTGTPPHDSVRTPLYEAKADPDIYFFGFDLTVEAAQGGPGTSPNDDPGWFFVLKERPGEARFGLELERPGALETFAELTWNDAIPGGQAGKYLPATALASVALAAPGSGSDNVDQHNDDAVVNAASSSAARWAYLLLRSPAMVAVHASALLGQGGS